MSLFLTPSSHPLPLPPPLTPLTFDPNTPPHLPPPLHLPLPPPSPLYFSPVPLFTPFYPPSILPPTPHPFSTSPCFAPSWSHRLMGCSRRTGKLNVIILGLSSVIHANVVRERSEKKKIMLLRNYPRPVVQL